MKNNSRISKKTIVGIFTLIVALICVVLVAVMTYIKNNAEESENVIAETSFVEEEPDVDGIVTGWGDNVGGRTMYTMHQVNDEQILGDHITFKFYHR